MESKKINQLATSVNPSTSDLAIIGDPITGVSKKITWLQVSSLIGTAANLQQVTDNGATTTNPITIGGLTISGLSTGVLKSDSGVISSVPFGAANGVATLGGDGKVPSNQLPSYVDDVVEVANYASLPVTGETGKIYITLDNNKVYRWTGSIYVEIAANNAVWGSITGTLSNQTDLQNALNAKVPTSRILTINGTSYDLSADRSWSITEAQTLITEVYNETGATLTKGTIVYINGGHGNLPTITKALASGDSTSAQTYGVVQTDITNNNNGYVVVTGRISNIDTQAYTTGTQLYLSGTTAGTWTSTKPYAPIHLVYVGIVVRSHPTQGIIEVKIQNGYELDELHNVSAQSPSNNDGIFYNTSTSLWEKKSIATALGYTPVPTTRTLTINGTTYDLSSDRAWTIETGLSGSGTTNYIPKFTGSTSVGNSTLQELSAGWLQLGSSSVNTSEFDIVGNTGAKLFLYDGYGSATIQSYYNDAFTILTQVGGQTTNVMDYNYATKTLIFQTNGNNTRLNITSSGNIGIGNTNDIFKLDVSGTGRFTGQLTLDSTITNGTYTYTLPSATGTLALTTDIPSVSGYVPYTGANANVDLGNYDLKASNLYSKTHGILNNAGQLYLGKGSAFTGVVGYSSIAADEYNKFLFFTGGTTAGDAHFDFSNISVSTHKTFTFPNANGTIALTSDIPSVTNFVTLNTLQTITGTKLYNSLQYFNNGLYLKEGVSGNETGYTMLGANTNQLIIGVQGASQTMTFPTAANYTYTFPSATGTIALTSNLSSYVPTSRTLTINGTTYDLSADRSWTVSGSQWTTSGSDIYYNTGNVGINQSSPTFKLDVGGTGRYTGKLTIGNFDGESLKLQLGTSTGNSYLRFYSSAGSGLGYIGSFDSAGTQYLLVDGSGTDLTLNGNAILKLNTGGTERMRITSTGNVGIGTSSPSYKLDVTGTGRFTGTITAGLANGNIRLKGSTDGFLGVGETNGILYLTDWDTAAKGMVINLSTGNVGIGTTSPTALGTGYTTLDVRGSSGGGINMGNATYSGYIYCDTEFRLQSSNSAITFLPSGTERMRISSAGNVGIGTSSPTNSLSGDETTLQISNTNVACISLESTGSGGHKFALGSLGSAGALGIYDVTAASYRMQIRNNGAVLIGTTTDPAGMPSINVGGSASSFFSVYNNYSSSAVGLEMTNSSNVLKIQFFGSSGNYYFAGSNLSDRRLKSNIIEMNEGLSKIIQLKPSTFTYDKNPDILKGGFIAQEVSEVIPEFVTIPEDENEMMGVDYFGILALAVKAIQEQNITIQELETRLKTLENK